MEIVCKKCYRGILTGWFGCNYCRTNTPVGTVLEYERVNYLLDEVQRPQWQAALLPDAREDLLRPYRIRQRTAAVQLGLIPLEDTEARRAWGRALSVLLNDLNDLTSPSLDQPEKTRLLNYLRNERDLLVADYTALNRAVPGSLDKLSAAQQRAVFEKCLEIIQEADLAEDSRPAWLALYRGRLDALQASAVAAANEAARRQHEEQLAQRAQLRLQLDNASQTLNTPSVPPTRKPTRPRAQFKWENVWTALLSETTLRALLYLGALFVVVAAGLYITLNWKLFPALIQATTLLGADLAFFGGAFFIVKKMRLRRAGLTFLAIASAILPLAFYGYSRPELINLDNRGTWTLVSWLALPCYLAITWLVRERLFSYLTSLAALNAVWAGLFQVGLTPDWIAVVSLPCAAGLIWLDGCLSQRDDTRELASAPFWVGQVTVAVSGLGLFAYFLNLALNGGSGESVRWALGIHWWLTTGFYAWCAYRDSRHGSLYLYGAALAGVVATFLTLQKLPVPTVWQGFGLGVVGLAYVVFQSFPALVRHLQADGNQTPWPVREVFGLERPFNNLGWLLILVSFGLSDAPLTWAADCTLLAVGLTVATLAYNWPRAAWGVVGATMVALVLLTVHLNINQICYGWLTFGASLLSLALWEWARRSPSGRLAYFQRPFEATAHLFALLLVVPGFLYHQYGYNEYSSVAIKWLTVQNWLLLALVWTVMSRLYRVRWGLDGAIALLTVSIFMVGGGLVGPMLAILGVGLALVGWIALEVRGRRLPGLALEQWGYGLATLALGVSAEISLKHGDPSFIITSGLYIALATASAWAAHVRRLTFWQELTVSLARRQINLSPALWVWIALGLTPLWVWRVVEEGSLVEKGMIMAGLSAVYAGLGLALAPLNRPEGRQQPGPYAVPALLGWLVLGLYALELVHDQPSYKLAIGVMLAVTAGLAAWRLADWRYNWLTVGWLGWVVWQGFQLSHLDSNWFGLGIAVFAVGTLVVGERLGHDYGRPFRVASHFIALLSLMATLDSALFIRRSDWQAGMQAVQIAACLLLTIMYDWRAIFRNPRLFYVMGLLATITLYLISLWLWLYRAGGWSPEVSLVAGFLALSVLAAGFYPLSLNLTRPQTGRFESIAHHALSHLSHIWAGLALVVSSLVYGEIALQTLTVAALLLLYVGRSWHEGRAGWLVVVALAGAGLTLSAGRLVGIEPRHSGLLLLGLAAIYLSLAYWLDGRSDEQFDYGLAGRIFRFGGQLGLGLGVVIATNDRLESLIALSLATVLAVWLAWQYRPEWAYGAAVSGLAAGTLAYWLVGGDWPWFGLALFGAAGGLALAGASLRRWAGPDFELVSRVLLETARLLTLVGLPLSWQKDGLMLIHLLALTGLGLVAFRLSRRLEWFYSSVAASCYAAILTIYLSGVSPDDYGLALLPVSVLYLVGLAYLARRAAWLDYPRRVQAVATLVTLAQGLALAGLYFSWTTDRRLAINLLALTAFYLFDLAVTRWTVWLYAALVAAHLAALASYSTLATGGNGLVPTQSALLLLVMGLFVTALAVRLGRTSGYNLATIAHRMGQAEDGRLVWLKIKSLPLYLAAGIDLGVALGLSLGSNLTGMVVASAVALTLLAVAVVEQTEWLTWGGLIAVVVAGLFEGRLIGLRFEQGLSGLALAALVLTCLAYALVWPTARVLAKPFGWAAHLVAGGVVSLWLRSFATSNNTQFTAAWHEFSWLLGILGLNYLIVSLIEQRRRTEESTGLRYLTYGAIMALEGAFVLRLLAGGVTQPQLYIAPVGLACLGFAWAERSYLNRTMASLLEGLGLTLLLGTALLQAFDLQTVGLNHHWYGILALVESLLAVGFGAANRLRYYFFGGIAALLLDLVALSADSVHNSSLWITIGLTGLALILLALFLERKRETVIALSKDWFNRLKEWQ